jgi:drug/metabolite transporter (DMT)-like permease
MSVVFLGLAASACWGIADFFGGVQTRRIPNGVLVPAATQACGLLLLVLFVLPFVGLTADTKSMSIAALGGIAEAGGIAALYAGLALGPMTVVAAISATASVIPVLFGIATGEPPTGWQGAGMAIAITGVLMAAQDQPLSQELRLASRRAVAFGALSALCMGVTLVTLERAAGGSNPVSAVFWNRLAAALLLAAAVIAWRSPVSELRRWPRTTVAISAADISGTGLFVVASTRGLLGVAAVISSIYPVVTVVLAYVILQERVRRSQLYGAALAFAGVAMMSLGG